MIRRNSNRLKGFDYSFSAAYFITVCVDDKECLLGKIVDGKMILNASGKLVKEIWLELSNRFENILLDEFVIMPNHFHGIIMIINNINSRRGLINQPPTANQTPTEINQTRAMPNWILMKVPEQTIGKIIRYFKGKSSYKIHNSGIKEFKWQRNYYDHIIRNEKDLNSTREYIYYNPVKCEFDKEYVSN